MEIPSFQLYEPWNPGIDKKLSTMFSNVHGESGNPLLLGEGIFYQHFKEWETWVEKKSR